MAESKKSSSGNKKTAHQTRNEAAEALRQAAELIESLNSEAQANVTKKPAAKKPAAKKPAAKSGTTKKPTAKKAVKTEPKQEASDEPKKMFGNRRSDCKNCGAENDKYALVCHVCGAQLPPLPEGMVPPIQPVVTEQKPEVEKPVEEKPVIEEKPVVQEQPVEEKPVVEEQPAVEEKPAEQPVAATEQPVEEKPAQPAKEKPAKKSGKFLDKVSDFINNKGKLPLWIVANVLLLLSSVFLIVRAFDIPNPYGGKSIAGGLFTYYGNAAAIKAYWQGTAGAWAGGGYAMLGILMFFSFLVPLALIVKNVLLLVLKKNKNVHMLDAIVTFAFLVAYLGVVGMYGANITWSHVLCLIMSIILLAYTIFVILLENRGGMFPFFSIANLVWILLCVFLLTNTKIYDAPRCYAAFVAALDGGAGFAFIMLLMSLAALVTLIVMQVKKLPGKIAWLFEFLVPAVAGVFAFIALITFAGLTPKGISMGGGFVCGAVFTLLLAIADVVFALVPPLHKFNVKVADKVGEKAPKAQPVAAPATAAAEQPATPVQNEQPAPAAQPAEKPAQAEQPAATEKPVPADKTKCPACGMENGVNDMYCMKCGRKLK